MKSATTPHQPQRRTLLAGAAATLLLPALHARAQVPMAPVSEGPFYPSPRWRAQGPFAGDWDADLTRVLRGGNPVRVAEGEHLGLAITVLDRQGRTIDGAAIEIWQCDARAQYRHARVPHPPGSFDEGFQGYGEARSGAEGAALFRTIRPVAYPGRTPHIHVKLRHASFGELTSQLFVAGERANEQDFLWSRLGKPERNALAMTLTPASTDGLRWQARHRLVVPA